MIKFQSNESYQKFANKSMSNNMFVVINAIGEDDLFTINSEGDVITLVREGTSIPSHFILKDDRKYFISVDEQTKL